MCTTATLVDVPAGLPVDILRLTVGLFLRELERLLGDELGTPSARSER